MSFRFWGRSALVMVVAMPLGFAGGGSAEAQRGCGPDYSIAIGDTLSGISRACGIPERALREANPQIDWNLLRIGAPVNIPDMPRRGRAEQSPESRRPPRGGPAGVYVVESGDTLRSVAAALGVDVAALLAANPGLRQRDLVPGREIRVGAAREEPRRPRDEGPRRADDDDGPRRPRDEGPRRSNDEDFSPPRLGDIDVSVDERSVEPGDVATVRVAGLPPRVPVVVRAGPARSDFSIEARGRSRRDGTARIELDIPERARAGARWTVEVLDPSGLPVAESSFRIAGRERRSTTVSGLLTREGIECPALRSDDGELYTLSGRLRRFRAGDPVTVTGRIADGSACQQGTTIEIERIESR